MQSVTPTGFFSSRIYSLQEVRFIKQALFPVLMCHAAGRGDIDAMEELRQQVTICSWREPKSGTDNFLCDVAFNESTHPERLELGKKYWL